MRWIEPVYTAALGAASALAPLFSRGEGKLARGLRGRAGVLVRMTAWAEAQRDPDRPLAWFHAPSVGEGLQARAVIERFRERCPEAQVAYTFFSPSAEGAAARMPADFSDYLPPDLPRSVERALDLLRPSVLAFSKTDVWPNLTREAERRGVRLALLSATLPAASSRLRAPARALLGPAYRRLQRVAAISEADADRFSALGVPPERREVMGDAHFDRVLARARATDHRSDLLRPLEADAHAVTIVAGSTWPADEERLLPAVAAARRDGTLLRLVLAPHEPTEAYLTECERRLDEVGLPHRRLARLGGRWSGTEVLLVDRIGVLGELYALADAAYVGGGWGSAGLHSVLEPAAFGVPVVFGPRHANTREAGDLVERGGAFSVATPRALRNRIRALATDAGRREAAGAAALAYIEDGQGAADRGAAVVEELLRG